MNIPTTRGIEYAARRLWRITSKSVCPRQPWDSWDEWSELTEPSRRGWRHLAVILWIQPYTRKGSR